jgi:hypothetical protein
MRAKQLDFRDTFTFKKAVLLICVEVEETLMMDIWLTLHNNNGQ